jgi:hypothetical protein
MRKRLVAVLVAAALGAGGGSAGIAASAASAGTWTCTNGGGNTVQGQTKCNGEGLTRLNPAGSQPPGQQP